MKNKLKYLIVFIIIGILFISVGCKNTAASEIVYAPIFGYKFWSWDFLVWPMAALMWVIGKTVAFGEYWIVIILATIIVRTAAWPIYAKSNDMTLKMQLMAPDQAKIEARYANKTDQESMQRKQMEVMQLYKKYGVGLSGCLMPFLQMPIFISFFNTLRRIPVSRISYLSISENLDKIIEKNTYMEPLRDVVNNGGKLPLDFEFLNSTFLGIDLFKDGTEGGWQKTGIYILAAVVCATQILYQILINRRQKKQKEKTISDVPAYRRPAKTDQQNQSEMMMKIMLYGMPVMMGFFVISSPAALGFYWLIGNLYSTLQSTLGVKSSEKRLEKLREKHESK